MKAPRASVAGGLASLLMLAACAEASEEVTETSAEYGPVEDNVASSESEIGHEAEASAEDSAEAEADADAGYANGNAIGSATPPPSPVDTPGPSRLPASEPDEPVSDPGALAALARQGAWLTDGARGTLTRAALEAVLATCAAIGERPRACAPRILARTGPFAAMDAAAASEAALLLRQCAEREALADCRTDIEDERYVRNQDIGRAEPNTLAMRQYEETIWSVAIRRTDARVTPGAQTVRDDSAPVQPGEEPPALEGAITFTEQTCFELRYHAEEFRVAADRVCPEYQRGNTPYLAKWTIEPLRSGTSQLWVTAVHERDGRALRAETVPTSPFTITVEHWLVEVLRELGLWNELAAAIGAIMTAVAGWGIWKLFRRKEPSAPSAD